MYMQMFLTGLGVVAIASTSQATLVKIQPDESASQDTFVYSRLPDGNATGVFQLTGDPTPAETASKHLAVTVFTTSTTTHMHTMLKLPIASLQVDDGEKAVIGLWSQAGFMPQAATPTSAYPVSLSLYPLTGTWNEDVTWNQHGLIMGASPIASVQVSGINQFVEFDITDDLAGLQAGSYEGFAIVQDAAVSIPAPPPYYYAPVGVFFAGAGDATASNRPYVAVVPVPEPASLGLLGLGAMLLRRRR